MDDSPDSQGSAKSRPTSRRSSVSLPRRNSGKKDKDRKPTSAQSTPKKSVKTAPDFMVTGKQILKKSDRANSLPGSYRRPSTDASASARRRPTEAAVKLPPSASSTVVRAKDDDELDDDFSLDLSQVSDFEDVNSKYGIPPKLQALATSTPKPKFKPRSASLQSQLHAQKFDKKGGLAKSLEGKTQSSLDGRSRDSTFSYSRDSLYKTSSSASPHRYELDYSSVSPEYSGQSSTEESPRLQDLTTPASLQASSCCVSSWQDSELDTKVCGGGGAVSGEGEWGHFWASYNHSYRGGKGAPGVVPVARYYDQCPTPYRTDTIDLADFDLSTEGSHKRSPNNITNINSIIRNEGLTLTPRETQNMIKCAHILGNVLSKAIERRSREKDDLQIEEVNEKLNIRDENIILTKKCDTRTENDINNIRTESSMQRSETEDTENKRRNLKPLNLKETTIPLEVKEEKRSETATTQTDISLPNTKSAPRIFENILRQLSKSSIDVPVKVLEELKEKNKEEKEKNKEEKEKNKEEKEKNKEEKEKNKEEKEKNKEEKDKNKEENEVKSKENKEVKKDA